MRRPLIRQRAIAATGRSEFAVPNTLVVHVTVVCDFQSTQHRDRRARALQLIEQSTPVSFVVIPMGWGFEQAGHSQ
jgi:hypothetical protein